jgi:hypothetical protein
MAEQNQEHIDQFFQKQFGEVEVRFNPSHWDALQQSLAAAAVGSGVASVQENVWQKLVRLIKTNPNVLLIVAISLILSFSVLFLMNKQVVNNASPGHIEVIEHQPQTSHEIIPGDTLQPILKLKNDSTLHLSQTSVAIQDSLLMTLLIPADSIDSMAIDTTKSLKNFIFW